MIPVDKYPVIGQVTRSPAGRLTLTPDQDLMREGILYLVERMTPTDQRLAVPGGMLRFAESGRLFAMLARALPECHAALHEGAIIDARFRDWPDLMAAAFTVQEIQDRRAPPWNWGRRR
ncbi:hypothetical protein [Nioella aestuarii]|uniref:hypothetical protein n=1 Tax=Nioella aestuarii TaxID=1662864 RepID=UPI003D7F7C1D